MAHKPIKGCCVMLRKSTVRASTRHFTVPSGSLPEQNWSHPSALRFVMQPKCNSLVNKLLHCRVVKQGSKKSREPVCFFPIASTTFGD